MNRLQITLLLLAVLVIPAFQLPAQTKTSYVDPFIGTDGMGHTFQGPASRSEASS